MPFEKRSKQISFVPASEIPVHPQPISNFYGSKVYPEILYYFKKTPPSIYCPHFWELRWAYGCPYDCAYCYLQGTFRGQKKQSHRPLNHILDALEDFFKGEQNSWLVNSGELSDSLMFPSIMDKIADKFEEQNKHKLLLLSKSSNVKFLVEKPRWQTVVSFSLNVPEVWKLWEKGTPRPERRIEAAGKVKEVGYETRVRIDPIFPIEDWRLCYNNLLYMIFEKLKPDRVTLGTPRGLKKTLMFSEDTSWAKYFTEDSGWGKKISSEVRKEIYIFFFDKLIDLGLSKHEISICKETKILWEDLGEEVGLGILRPWEKCKCNCEL